MSRYLRPDQLSISSPITPFDEYPIVPVDNNVEIYYPEDDISRSDISKIQDEIPSLDFFYSCRNNPDIDPYCDRAYSQEASNEYIHTQAKQYPVDIPVFIDEQYIESISGMSNWQPESYVNRIRDLLPDQSYRIYFAIADDYIAYTVDVVTDIEQPVVFYTNPDLEESSIQSIYIQTNL